ncbi:hypothetical protein PGT21_030320 [Puccinia graminis f. sp. tritici]|uniref:Uncharacterized protein n=1 Tax=Puccinia graminis f. sp. tritici TaxID=56615 RepID=A0A5B0NRF2_PUCGR|nr:hypothetical protein PGTUg99_025750 [Puccinia graminis f. sp. tritici]KAA1091232.1 hypothetical protein PGT21_029248 [Puccinia graminis f. sp. tritici]KAA1110721.1 hypothetical protein PGT21_030320 [Puccinia graminis f. sp. tritici]
MTPQQQIEPREQQITTLPPSLRTIHYPNGYPTRLNTSGKRSVDEHLSLPDQLEENMKEFNCQKPMSSISSSASPPHGY